MCTSVITESKLRLPEIRNRYVKKNQQVYWVSELEQSSYYYSIFLYLHVKIFNLNYLTETLMLYSAILLYAI